MRKLKEMLTASVTPYSKGRGEFGVICFPMELFNQKVFIVRICLVKFKLSIYFYGKAIEGCR